MSDFQVSARKFRPDTFEKVLGQNHITLTLKNSLLNNAVAQAYLFCGPRGVGKTTCARILAKAINCLNLTHTGDPCNLCTSCQAIINREATGIFELDAASNNSVEDIRNLVEQIRYVPQHFKHNVYIIDEVHMLSNSAFNAFLKTLEEPPKHAVFILATTEKQKIIPTIISRCQVFDFKRISNSDIVHNLKNICLKKNISIDESVLFIIADKADGAMRDALSLFDMLSNSSQDEIITLKIASELLHIIGYDSVFLMTEFIYNSDLENCLKLYYSVLDSGFDGHNFIVSLAKHIRNLLFIDYAQSTANLLALSADVIERYKSQAAQFDTNYLVSLLQKIIDCEIIYKQSYNKSIVIGVVLISATNIKFAPSQPQQKTNTQIEKREQTNNTSPLTHATQNSNHKNPIYEQKKLSSHNQIFSTYQNTQNDKNSIPYNSKKLDPLLSIDLPSLDDLYNENKTSTTTINTNNNLLDLSHFDDFLLQQSIDKFAEKLKTEKKSLESSIFIERIYKKNDKIFFKVYNGIQKSILENISNSIIDFLKSDILLNPQSYSIGCEILEVPIEIKETTNDILNQLIEKNSAVKTIFRELDCVLTN